MATENLKVFNNIPAVEVTCIYNRNDVLFIGFANNEYNKINCPRTVDDQQNRFYRIQLIVIKTITVDKKKIGSVLLLADLSRAYWRKIRFIGLVFLTLAVVSLVSFLLSQPLLKFITTPIRQLAATVNKITDTGDYSLRAKKLGNDETGVLIDSINSLIETVGTQNQALVRAKNCYLNLYDDNPTMVFNVSHEGLIISANLTGRNNSACRWTSYRIVPSMILSMPTTPY